METQEVVVQDQEEIAVPQGGITLEAMFAAPTTSVVYGGRNQLDMTARLTAMSTDITSAIIKELNAKGQEYAAKVAASQKSHDAMDDLINELYPLGTIDASFLEDIDAEEVDKMIRSQQSKRSRAKSKVMSLENYRTMMVGAVAENILRITSGKQKSYGGGAIATGDVGYTDEDLEKLAMDPEELKKAIRNVQSKKSIMKAKAEFADETVREASPRWQQLLLAEAQLKAIRDQGAAQLNEEARQALDIRNQASELLADVDVTDMAPDEAQRLLLQVKQMLSGQ